MRNAMMKLAAEEIDVAEFHSPPRIVKRAKDIGLRPGWSLDITTRDYDGKPWDFNDPEKRERALALIDSKKALLLIGSPMC